MSPVDYESPTLRFFMLLNPKNLPLRDAKCLFWTLRRALFTKPKPDVDSVVVRPTDVPDGRGTALDRLRLALGDANYSNAVETSWHYRGEVLNMARPDLGPAGPVRKALVDAGIITADEAKNADPWCQTHVRGYRLRGGLLELQPHFELAPTDWPRGHIDGVYFDRQRGIDTVVQTLAAAGIETERSPKGDALPGAEVH